MDSYPKWLLLSSYLLLFLNCSPLGYILYLVRLGPLYGGGLMIFSSLAGAVIASLAEAEDSKMAYYCRLAVYTHCLAALLPLLLPLMSRTMIPELFTRLP